MCNVQIHTLYTHTTYPFRFGEVHSDKAVVVCFVISLNDKLVFHSGDVRTVEQREDKATGDGWERSGRRMSRGRKGERERGRGKGEGGKRKGERGMGKGEGGKGKGERGREKGEGGKGKGERGRGKGEGGKGKGERGRKKGEGGRGRGKGKGD